jgi:hypothetical protein
MQRNTFYKATQLSSIAVMVLFLAAGCDRRPSRVPVSGKVIIDGQPLSFGIVTFVSQKGRPSVGVLDKEGRFTLGCYTTNDGAIIGKHQVQVSATEGINNTTSRIHALKRYGLIESSGIEREITAATDSMVIELTWKGDVHNKPYTEKANETAKGGDDEAGLKKRYSGK